MFPSNNYVYQERTASGQAIAIELSSPPLEICTHAYTKDSFLS